MDGDMNAASVHHDDVGRGPSQALRKGIIAISIVFAVAFLFVADSYWISGSFMHEAIEWLGFDLILTCIFGRTWSTLFIGGRKNTALVESGPYSVSRNPLYVFSIIGATGVGAQFGSVTVALVCGFFAWAVLLWTAWREEASLLAAFGEDYRRYIVRVPRFMPNFSLWHSPDILTVQPRMITVTFLDAVIFLIAIPIAKLFEYLHDIHVLPVYFTVP